MKTFFKSIRWQIQVWYGLILFFATILFAVIYYQLIWLEKGREIDIRLDKKRFEIMNTLRTAVLEPGNNELLSGSADSGEAFILLKLAIQTGILRIPDSLNDSFSGTGPGHYYFRIEDQEGNLVLQSENVVGSIEFPASPQEGAAVKSKFSEDNREIAIADASGLKLAVGQDISTEIREMRRIMLRSIVVGTGVWIIGLFGGWMIAGHIIRPVSAISRAALRISEGNLDDRIHVKKPGNELHELSSVLNTTFDRLQKFVERQRQFTADASHELRTPLTVIIAESQRMQKKDRTAKEYREALALISNAGGRMKKLVDDLLFLARLDSGEPNLQTEFVDIRSLAEEIIASHRVLAENKSIVITSKVEPLTFEIDPTSLTIVINNILGNAISHHQGTGNVELEIHGDSQYMQVAVKDDGPGISEDSIPKIFNRFYRAEKARTSTNEHSGLGLAVCKSLIEKLGGTIHVKSDPGKGSEFTIHFRSNH